MIQYLPGDLPARAELVDLYTSVGWSLTDDEQRQHRFYKAAGYSDIASLGDTPLHAFVNFKGQDLT